MDMLADLTNLKIATDAEYEANRVDRLGETSIKPITYAPLVNA